MALASMTGFARAAGGDGALDWVWEAKSVNGRGLDLRFRLPPGFDRLEIPARAAVAARFKRGSIALSLRAERIGAGGGYSIDRAALAELVRVTREIAREHGAEPPRLDTLLTLRGVVDQADPGEDEAVSGARDAAVAATLEEALTALTTMRLAEGARLRTLLLAQLDTLEGLRRAAEATAAAHPEAARARLRQQVAALLESAPPLSEDRLAQEAALIAARADIREEIDRFGAHIAAARELVQAGGAVGRRLDFLCQELNRESNTICSKSADLDLTRVGLELKAVVEQFREQVQNVE